MILCISSQKGGVGKTTTAQTLAAGLHKRGYKVLMIDLDPQCNLTYSAGIDPSAPDIDLQDVLQGTAPAARAVLHTAEADLIPGSYALTSADVTFTKARREYLLADALKPLRAAYDYIVMDCPPTLGVLTINALTASDAVLIPMTANIFSIQGLAQLFEAVSNVKKYANPGLTIDGLLVTRYRQANISRDTWEAIESVAQQIGTRLYAARIREGIAVSTAQDARGSLFATVPTAKVTEDYNAFISEFLKERA